MRHSNMRLHTLYRIVHTTMGDPWQRWLTLSTRQTRGLHPWRYIPLSPSNDPYKFFFFTLHYTSLQQPPMTKHYLNRSVFYFTFVFTAQFLFCCNLLFFFYYNQHFNTSIPTHNLCTHTMACNDLRDERTLSTRGRKRRKCVGSILLSLKFIFKFNFIFTFIIENSL